MNISTLSSVLARTKRAQQAFSKYRQEDVDRIFKHAALSANMQRLPLAKLAVRETGMGVMEDKVIKNHFASEFIYNKYKNTKTCGVISRDAAAGIIKVAEPMGIIAGVVPTTNPTSTAIFKSLLALKTRNGIILSPHPRAVESTIAAARIVRDAAVEAGAPEDIIGWIDEPSVAISRELMQHPDVKLILATGGPQMVKSAYSSGTPAIGVGAGNTPAVIDATADIPTAVSSILISKTFDNGMICASEQSVIVEDIVYDRVKAEFMKRGAYFASGEDIEKIRGIVLKDGHLNPAIVGQNATTIMYMSGIPIPCDEKIRCIITEVDIIGADEPLAAEKLCPILAMYRAPTFEAAVDMANELVEYGGRGHTSVLYTNENTSHHIADFYGKLNTARILVNTPSSQGAIGDIYNFHLDPSLTLGCGTWGGTSVSNNVTPEHLLNTKTISERKENMLWFRVPPKIYFKGGSIEVALKEMKDKKRCFVITDKPLYDIGLHEEVTRHLDAMGIKSQVFYHVTPDPTLEVVENGLTEMRDFSPDVIIALGGGSPMDAAKVMWLMYENPEMDFTSIASRFMDIRKRIYDIPPLGKRAELICIPTTSGTGSEVTPFSVITDQKTGQKYPLADYALTPSMAIIDHNLVMNMPKSLVAFGGIDAVTHALESYVSICATDFTRGLSKEALQLLFTHLPESYKTGDEESRERVHYASTIAGMAFANAFLGICHSMAHKLGARFHIPHGLANALLITHVIRYNATDAPEKQAAFSQYKYPHTKKDYYDIAVALDIVSPVDSVDQGIERLITHINKLKADVGIPMSIKEVLGEDRECEYVAAIAQLAEEAFDDQCTVSNPRYPLVNDMINMYQDAWYGS
jgi:acetaldehyde dehydrogenase/alcohol dehydrogenase